MGRHTLRLREATRARGFPSEIFVDTVDDDTADETVPVLSYPETAQPGDVLVYQFATASAMAPWLAGRSETLVVNYHNVTPPELMAPWDNHLALGQLRAQGDVRLLAPRTALAVADSRYNEAHLTASGFTRTAVVSPSAALSSAGTTSQDAEPPPAVGADAVRAGWPSGASRPTRGSRAPSRRSLSPAPTATPTPRCGSSASRRPIPTSPRCSATWPSSASARAVQFAGHASDATVAVGLCRRGRAGRDVRARGLLRPRRRGDGRRRAGGGVRPGGRARGARRCRGARLGQGPLRAGSPPSLPCCATRRAGTP